MKKVISLFILIPILASAQSPLGGVASKVTKNGVKFNKGLTFEQAQRKAQAENKYIFIDCYATWCGPCKYMDQEIFIDSSVASFINCNFIALKLQMDITSADDLTIKKQYLTAQVFKQKYNINVLPTYLFFGPRGEIVHKEIGQMIQSDFLVAAKKAMEKKSQFYRLYKFYKDGVINFDQMRILAETAKRIGEREIAKAVSTTYISRYLFKLNEKDLYTRKNIEFLYLFTQSSLDEGFRFFIGSPKKIDSIMSSKSYVRSKLDYIIKNEIINPILSASLQKSEPNWDSIGLLIKTKYSESYAKRGILNAKEDWYTQREQWEPLHKMYLEKFEKFGVELFVNGADSNTEGATNNMAWEIFLHSTDTSIINKAIQWMEIIVTHDSLDDLYEWKIDTYANLLYKAGKIDKAIANETLALNIAIERSKHKDLKREIEALQSTLYKMKKGEPTWSYSNR